MCFVILLNAFALSNFFFISTKKREYFPVIYFIVPGGISVMILYYIYYKMLILLENADYFLLFRELLRNNFRDVDIYNKDKEMLKLYLKNIGYKYIEIK